MPTVIGYHEIKDAQHWLSSPKREELFGPIGITTIRTFVDPQNPTRSCGHGRSGLGRVTDRHEDPGCC